MTDKTAKYIEWAIGLGILISSIFNLIWPTGMANWAYWASRFLISGEMLAIGLAFMLFPKIMLRLVIAESDYNNIKPWKLSAGGFIVGLGIFLSAMPFFTSLVKVWTVNCSYVLDCIP